MTAHIRFTSVQQGIHHTALVVYALRLRENAKNARTEKQVAALMRTVQRIEDEKDRFAMEWDKAHEDWDQRESPGPANSLAP